jgi:hypothetical protein
MTIRLRGLFVACLLTAVWSLSVHADTSLDGEWINGWKQYAQTLRLAQGTVDWSAVEQGGRVKVSARLRFRQNTRGKMVEEFRRNSHDQLTVWCYNPTYSFSLSKSSVAERWKLDQVSPFAPDQLPALPEPGALWFDMFREPVSVRGVLLADLVAKPSFSVKSITKQQTSPPTWRLAFTNHHQVELQRGFDPIQEGDITLSDDRHHVVLQYKIRCLWPAGQLTTYDAMAWDYRNDGTGVAVPISYFLTQRDTETGPVQSERRCACDLETSGPLPADEEFRLPAFGISEPDGLKATTSVVSRSVLGLLAAIMLGLCLAVVRIARSWRLRAADQSHA